MSSCEPWALKNQCSDPSCQHEKDSHHEGKHNCLALYCQCLNFRKPGEVPKATPKPEKPKEQQAFTFIWPLLAPDPDP